MGKLKNDFTGMRFGKLVVIERAPNRPNCTAPYWYCQCDCGSPVKSIRSSHLSGGNVKSCGCLNKQRASELHMKHGGCTKKDNYMSRLYSVWNTMINRCHNPNATSYKDYGAKGITVCPEWRNDFAVFRDWALSHGYNATAERGQCTIDRIDPCGGYSPDNCRWVDMQVQQKNKRNKKKTEGRTA